MCIRDRIDADRARKGIQPVRGFTAKNLLTRRYAGAIDEAMQMAKGIQRISHCRFAICLARDVGLDEAGVVTKFCGQRDTGRDIHIAQNNLGAIRDKCARDRCTKPVSYTHLDVYKRQWQGQLYRFLARNSAGPTDYFHIPAGRVVEIGAQVNL